VFKSEKKLYQVIQGFIVSAIVLLAVPMSNAGEMVGTKSKGTWVKGDFAQVNIGCMQAWICKAPSVIHGNDTKVVTTPNEGSKGMCNTAGGDITGCQVCASSAPKTACEYWLEKR
jgi:hypothetical protein